jgi:hypothetical protein
MQYNTKDLINFASTKNSIDFTTALNNILASKMQDSVANFEENICSNIFKTGYGPHNPDEEEFMNKHIPSVVDYPVENHNDLPFKDNRLKMSRTENIIPDSYDKDEDEDEDEKYYKHNIHERKLTSSEIKKREEIAKALERKYPKMPMERKMAIATAQAKKSV